MKKPFEGCYPCEVSDLGNVVYGFFGIESVNKINEALKDVKRVCTGTKIVVDGITLVVVRNNRFNPECSYPALDICYLEHWEEIKKKIKKGYFNER